MALKHVVLSLALHNVAAGVGTALPPYKHRRGFFARGGGFAIGNTGPSEEIEALAGEAFDWLANLGAPAALVAGAVIATMIDQATFCPESKNRGELRDGFSSRSSAALSNRSGDFPESPERQWRLEHESRAARGQDRERPKGKRKLEKE